MLESYLRTRLKEKDILLMTHIVLGYPSFEDNFRIIETMVEADVELMELQIPFSEPVADGPVILQANQKALERGATVEGCLNFAEQVAQTFDIQFLMMTYYDIPFRYGTDRFVCAMANKGLQGAIIPDLPPEEGREYFKTMKENRLAPVLIFSPTTTDKRMKYLDSFARGFIYCMARKGVTGTSTSFSNDLGEYLARCRKATNLPLALGFGVKEKTDIDFLKGKVDIAVIGTQTIRVMEKGGIASVGDFIRGLR
ncbi:MAG: tryptophan synthase subunit alpha [Desulfobacterales bacterium]|nr:tryptophan synthase subunit alpha [Desulfobacterales bacterium]